MDSLDKLTEEQKKYFSDISKMSEIVDYNPCLGIYFEKAIRPSISSLKDELISYQIIFDKLAVEQEKLKESSPRKYFDNLTNLSHHEALIKWISGNLSSIIEMKLINIYKDFEIRLKDKIEKVYNDIDVKLLFRWDLLINFLKSKNIEIENLIGYSETNQLRQVNNQIKHGSKLNNEIKTIKEFKNLDIFTYTSLDKFLNRIEKKVNTFFSNLTKEIYAEQRQFNDERLTKMAVDFKRRMDKPTMEKFIMKLKEL